MWATALSSSSRTAGLLTVGSTFTTSTLGTSSGPSPAGASAADDRRSSSNDTVSREFDRAIRALPARGVPNTFDQFSRAAGSALNAARGTGIEARCDREGDDKPRGGAGLNRGYSGGRLDR